MHPKDAEEMANSVDPDQTASSEAVWSWSALFAEIYLSQYIEFVRYKICSMWHCMWRCSESVGQKHCVWGKKNFFEDAHVQLSNCIADYLLLMT